MKIGKRIAKIAAFLLGVLPVHADHLIQQDAVVNSGGGWTTSSNRMSFNSIGEFHLDSQLLSRTAYVVALQSEPSAGGALKGAGAYFYGAVADLNASPSHGYDFSHWSGAELSDHNATEISHAITGNVALTAHFIAHPDAGELYYELNATEHQGDWKKSHWFGYFSQANENWAYHYDFGWIYIDQVADDSFWYWQGVLGWLWTNAEVFPSTWSKNHLDWIRFSLDRATDQLQTDAKGRLFYYDYSATIWTRSLTTFEVDASVSPTNGGSVSGAGSYEEGAIVPLTAIPAEGYEFLGWSGDVSSGSGTISFSADAAKTVVANFKQATTQSVIDGLFR